MGKNNICVIYDSDESYAKRLMSVINDDNDIPYNAQVFTKENDLDRYLKEKKADMLMISEEAYEYDSDRVGSKTVVLCEEDEDADEINTRKGEDLVGVCKYQPSYQILQSVIDEYPQRKSDIKIISHEKNMGSGVARNTGLEVADGEYIIYCDGDDWVDPDMYEKLYIKAREDNADIVMCDYYEEKQGKRIRCSQNPFRHKGNIVEQMLVGQLHSSVCGALVRRSLYEDNHIQFPVGISMWEDLCTSVRLHCFVHRVSYVEEAFYHYVIYMNSVSHHTTMKQLEDMIGACVLIESFLKEQGLYSLYHIPFLRRCFYAKKAFLVNKNLRNFNLWRELWPESNRCLKEFQIRFYHRMGYYLANLEYYRLAVGVLKFSDKMDDCILSLIGKR